VGPKAGHILSLGEVANTTAYLRQGRRADMWTKSSLALANGPKEKSQ
jgi:hypothetical protein